MSESFRISPTDYDDSPGGVDCYYVKISSNSGLKLFRSKETRDRSVANQKRLAEHGLAPKVFAEEVDVYDCGIKGSVEFYAYETEHVSDVRPQYCNNFSWNDEPKKRRFLVGVDTLLNQLSAIGVHWLDSHTGNLGFLDGQPVLIDCADKLFDEQREGLESGARV